MTQTELSKKIGISRQNVNTGFTKGADISDRMLIRIVQVVEDIDARWLITGIMEGLEQEPKQETKTSSHNPISTESYEVVLGKLMDISKELGSKLSENKILREQIEELKKQIMELQRLRPGT